MPLRKLPAEALDADNPRVGVLSHLSDPASTSVADADEIAQAETRAEAARARAIRLRQQAEAASTDHGNRSSVQETDGERDVSVAFAEEEAESAPSRRRRLHRPLRLSGRKALAAAAAVVFICATLTASGYLAWHHHKVVQQRQRTAEFAAAARNAVVTMMSLDPRTARDDMQRFADNTTGLFKAGILMGAEDAVKALEQSKVSSKGAVQAAAVESMTEDSAIVLVAAKSEFTKPGQAKPESRTLRLVVDVQRDGGQLKISRIEFVP
jgi:Mce-associated membrane protein